MSAVFIAKYFSWWLGSWSLGISYDYNSGVTSALLVGLENRVLRSSFIRLLKSKAELAGHPSLLPLLLCDTLAERHAREVHLSTNRILELETSIGVNDYTDGTPVAELDEADFTRISQSLNGELSRLANYEKWVNSHIVLLKEVLNGDGATGISTDSRWHSRSAQQTRKLEVMIKQYGNSLLGWNVDLLARIACQQKIVQGQIQTVYNLLAQRDNRLNIEIARASKRDSTAMKTIAILTMMFLPGAFIATLFSMNMFNWQAENGENVLSAYFWVYWVITVPITAIVLLIWMAWYRPWKA
ncbi:hypothetical protein BDZ45DRAFT_594255 [Acephala macrosclerotiorum]|nr:hypothetical protein BDZ45DRAFT_594255 [Acephala macrosclerotiorum]